MERRDTSAMTESGTLLVDLEKEIFVTRESAAVFGTQTSGLMGLKTPTIAY
jgi:hypothetical protein